MGVLAVPFMVACSSDDLGPTIFPDVDDNPDPSSATYKFDKWLNQNFRDTFNVSLKYRMEDVEANMNYNLVPAKLGNAQDIAVLTKYLWYDSYTKLKGSDFLKSYGPKMIHLIGSPAYNPANHSEIVGLAEGGVKVTLFKINELDINDIDKLNEYYFRTMHHEFAHILHQTKSYPTSFNLLSTGRYDETSWTSRKPGYVASLGFVTPYASSQTREDFAETIANYLTRSDEQMELIYWMAKQGWTTKDEILDEEAKKNAIYYCYYYIDPKKPDDKHYILQAYEKITGCIKMGMLSEDLRRYFTTVQEVEDYLDELRARGYEVHAVEDADKIDGYDIIIQKQNIARAWLKDEWGINLDELRDVVQTQQKNVDIDALRKQIDDMK